MNITHVTAGIVPVHSDLGGGIERHIRAVTSELADRGHDVSIVDSQHGPDDPATIDGVTVRRISRPSVSTGFLDGWADHVFNECIYSALLHRASDSIRDADVVHAHNMYAGLRAKRLAQSADVPFIYTCQNGMWCADSVNAYERHVVRGLEGRIADEAEQSIAVSKAVQTGLRRHAGTETTVVPNGVDVDKFSPNVDTSAVVKEKGLDEARTVLFVGRIARAKGIDVLIRAAERVVEKSDDPVQFVLVGPNKHMYGGSEDEGYGGELDVAFEAAGVRDRFIFTGEKADNELRQYYAAADVFVLPSRFEALPLVVLESLASGTPVVGSTAGGIPEMVTDDVGRTVPIGDDVALAEALVDVLDPETNERMSTAARERAESVYAWPNVVDRLEAIYEAQQ